MSQTAIEFQNVTKQFDNAALPSVDQVSLTIEEGEFITILGSSGSGKTTLLKMVNRLYEPTGGKIFLFGEDISTVDVVKVRRRIGYVIQQIGLFPHMTIADNISVVPKLLNWDKKQTDERVDELLNLVGLLPEEFKNRYPSQLSGGQQQRIALARAIVIEPDVLLMDEPLSNLDAKLRVEMRDVIKELQHKVGITTIYVTHDQEEAMAVSDRIAVMKDGVIQQVGRPRSIYHRPANIFVATFIGSSNIIHGRLLRGDFGYRIQIGEYVNPIEGIEEQKVKDEAVLVSIRPEDFVISKDQSGLKGRVISSVFLGNSTRYDIELETGDVVMLMEESTETDHLIPDSKVYLKVKTEKINVYDREGNVNYSKGVVSDLE